MNRGITPAERCVLPQTQMMIRLGMRYATGPLPTIVQLMTRYECSRATAYRWLAELRVAREAYEARRAA